MVLNWSRKITIFSHLPDFVALLVFEIPSLNIKKNSHCIQWFTQVIGFGVILLYVISVRKILLVK